MGPKYRVRKEIKLPNEELKLEKLRVQMRRNELKKKKIKEDNEVVKIRLNNS